MLPCDTLIRNARLIDGTGNPWVYGDIALTGDRIAAITAPGQLAPEQSLQFERLGFFVADRRDHSPAKPVFNRSVTLRDTWAGKAGG